MKSKNLVIFHLESVSWQTLSRFPEAFPNFSALMPTGRLFRSYFSSATSTQMVLAYLAHGNDFELDAATGLSRPAANNPSLFAILAACGYRTEFLGVTAHQRQTMLPLLTDTLPPIWSTNDFSELLEKFEALTASQPFAIYAWNLVTHIEHAIALAPHATGLDDLVGGACAVADHALGALLSVLMRKDLLDDTTVVIFADHGDDYWTHGFKKGLIHGVEPYNHVVHVPLLIRDASLPAGNDNRLASTIDLAPTLLGLLGLSAEFRFADSGRSLLSGVERACAFSQNFTANQPDSPDLGVRKSFAASDRSYTLLVSSEGLEFFNHRLDPTNHCNLLHFFEMDQDGELVFRPPLAELHEHFDAAMEVMLSREHAMSREFARLRGALEDHIGRKRAYVAGRAPAAAHLLDPACLRIISTRDRRQFLARLKDPVAVPAAAEVARNPPARSLLGGLVKSVFRGGGRVGP